MSAVPVGVKGPVNLAGTHRRQHADFAVRVQDQFVAEMLVIQAGVQNGHSNAFAGDACRPYVIRMHQLGEFGIRRFTGAG